MRWLPRIVSDVQTSESGCLPGGIISGSDCGRFVFFSGIYQSGAEVEIRDQMLDLVKSAAMTDRQSQLECLITNCTNRPFHHLGNLFTGDLVFECAFKSR